MKVVFSRLNSNVFDGFGTKFTLDELIALNEDVEIHLGINLDSNEKDVKEKLSSLTQKTNGTKVKIIANIESNKEYLYSPEEIQQLKSINQLCENEKIHANLVLKEASGTYEQFVMARNEVDNFGKRLAEQKIGNRSLSTGEKFICIYSFVANRFYKANENFLSDNMRNWIGVLSGDEVICSGFASTLKMMCDRFFTKEELVCFTQTSTLYFRDSGERVGGHANNIVYINDKLYNYEAIRHSDSCWDSLKPDKNTPSYKYCMLPMDKMSKYDPCITEYSNELYVYDGIGGKREKDGLSSGFGCEFNTYIESLTGQKTDEDIKKLAEEVCNERTTEIDNERNKRQTESKEFFNKQRSNFSEYELSAKIINLTPTGIAEKFPITKEYDNYLQNLSMENFDVNKIKEIVKFYTEHKDIVKRVEQELEEYEKDGFFFNFLTSMEYIVKYRLYENAVKSLEYPTWEQEQQVKDKLFAEKHKNTTDFIKPLLIKQDFPEEMLRNGIYASLILLGHSEDDAKKLAEQKLEERKKFHGEYFNSGENITQNTNA